MEDTALLEVREDLHHHVTQFNEKKGLDLDKLVKRYRKSVAKWVLSGETARIIKHTVHIAAWIVFGTRTFGRTPENVGEQLSVLLCEMLSARSVQPTPRLVHVLRYVEEFYQDFEDDESVSWASLGLQEVRKAIIDHDGAFLRSHLGARHERSEHGEGVW